MLAPEAKIETAVPQNRYSSNDLVSTHIIHFFVHLYVHFDKGEHPRVTTPTHSLGAVGEDDDAETVEEAVGEAALVDCAIHQLHLAMAVPLATVVPVADVRTAVWVGERAELAWG